jgi:IS30 family transposase
MTAHHRQLTQSQRYQIEAGLASDMSLSRIAKQIGAHPSTVNREVRRSSNGGPLYLHLRQRRRLYRKRYGSCDRLGQARPCINKRAPCESSYLSAYQVKRRTRRQVTRAINIQLKEHQVHTLTLDNGKEFAGHERIALKSSCDVYFADPYASWQRGTNENTNGLLRPSGVEDAVRSICGDECCTYVLN